jgi:hypothetical protein
MKRREFIKTSALGATVLPCLGVAGVLSGKSKAWAEGETIVALDDPTAKALGYVHDAETVDVAKWPTRASTDGVNKLCSNCNLIVGESKSVAGEEGKWIGCQLFPGKLVNENGWCSAWVAKIG